MFKKNKQPPPTIAELEEQARIELDSTTPHYHKDENGFLVQCYHSCRKSLLSTVGSAAFWIGVTISYPLEHALWKYVPGFSHIAEWLGMH